MRIFLDANILFSAAKTDGAIRRLVSLVVADGHKCMADGYVLEEARRNLERVSPLAIAELDRVLARVHVSSVVAPATADPALLVLPEKDRPVLGAAAALGCDVLLTGDRTHFGSHFGRTLAAVKIHSPQTLARELFG
jgi:predicted nucleic acid-binding protein